MKFTWFLFLILLAATDARAGIDFVCGWQKLPRPAPPRTALYPDSGRGRMFSMAPPAPREQPFLLEVGTREDFLGLSRKVRSGGGEQDVVKVLFHRKAPGGEKLYYFNTKEYPYHGWFAEAHTGWKGTEEEFNRNYEGNGENRSYNQGTLVLSKGTGPEGKDQLLFEVWTGDTIDAKHLKDFYDQVRKNMKLDLPIVFHPLSVDQERLAHTPGFPIPSVSTEELFKGKTYQSLNEGVAYGYVKIVDPNDHDPLLGVTDIAVFEQVPNDIGLVGGVVTGEFQTPLSHVNVKSINRGTVNMALKGAREELKKYAGKPIELKVEGGEYKIRVLPEHEAQRLIADFWSTKRPKAGETPSFVIDPRFRGKLQDLSTHYRRLPTKAQHEDLIRRVGAKAANLALIQYILRTSPNLEGVTSPATFAAHFGLYDEFMATKVPGRGNGTVAKKIEQILNRENLLDPTRLHAIDKVRPALEEIRTLIQNTKVPEAMIREMKRVILDDPNSPIHHSKNPILLLRSSTNSEDMDGFSGAGLYNSTALQLYDADATGKLTLRKWADIEKDLRKKIPYVYSSVWNERAFQEREWYQINGRQHLDIKAGIAIHGGFNGTVEEGKIGETANGVAITTNIYDPSDRSKIYINGQHYGLSVTNPPSADELAKYGGNVGDRYLTEEVLVTNFVSSPEENLKPDVWKKWPFERKQSSSVNQRNPVFANDEETRRLAVALQTVSDRMARVYGKRPQDFIADIEWNIFGRDRVISINQSRPFTPPKTAEPEH